MFKDDEREKLKQA